MRFGAQNLTESVELNGDRRKGVTEKNSWSVWCEKKYLNLDWKLYRMVKMDGHVMICVFAYVSFFYWLG